MCFREASLVQRNAITDNADHDTLDDECLLGEIDLYRLEFLVLRQQPDARTILPVALDSHLVLETSHDDLAAAHLGGTMHRNEISIENARVFHAHSVNTQ